MSVVKRFIPIQASLERILDTSSNGIPIQDGKVLYTIDGGFSFFDLSGIRYLKASVAAVEDANIGEDNFGIIRLRSAKGGISVVNSLSDGYKIYYTDSSGEVFHVAGGVSPDTKNTAGATNSTEKLFLVGSPTQDSTPQTYTNVNVFAQNGELTANKLIAKEKIELGVESGPTDIPVTTWWEFDPLDSNALNFRNKNSTGRAILQITNSNKIIAYTDNITSAINTLNTIIQTQLEGKQDTLVSGINIKTLSGQSLLGSGNLTLADIGAAATIHTHTYADLTGTVPIWNQNTTGNAATATKLGTTTVGSGIKPIYLNTGTPTELNSTVGSASVPVYLNAGVITATTGVATKTELTSGLALKVGLSGNEDIAGIKNFTGTILYNGEEVATLEDLTTVFKYMGSKATYADLPSTDRRIGDVWNVLDTGNNYAWSGTEWDNLAGVVDLSNYYTKAEINTLLNAKENLANKVDSFTTGSATLYPTTNAVKTYVDTGLLLKENVSNKKTTLTDSAVDYPSTGAVKTYVDTQITTIDNSKVDNAPTDGKVYGQQYGDWTSLEDTAELRDALCFEGS